MTHPTFDFGRAEGFGTYVLRSGSKTKRGTTRLAALIRSLFAWRQRRVASL
jgi:hypothetical protein